MSGDEYIYIPHWDRFQHYKNRRPVWIKVYLDLLDKDEYLALSLADRGLLQDIWKLISIAGNGRLRYSRVSLGRRLNVRRVSLEPLIQAGFIELRASKALADPLAIEKEKEKNPLTPAQRGNGLRANGENPRALTAVVEHNERRTKQLAICRRMWREGLDNGEPRSHLHEALAREFPHDPSIVTETEPPLKETA